MKGCVKEKKCSETSEPNAVIVSKQLYRPSFPPPPQPTKMPKAYVFRVVQNSALCIFHICFSKCHMLIQITGWVAQW